MQPIIFKALTRLFSQRLLMTILCTLFLFVVFFMPLFALLVITQTGIPIVSNSLVSVNTKTQSITIRDPTGKVIKTLEMNTTWPLRGTVTLEFGESDLPYQPLHTGIDIANVLATPVTPFMKGKVSFIGNLNWGYGNYIIIDHGSNITSLYAHLSAIGTSVGQTVTPGDTIGLVGQSGWATGPHTHFEIRVYDIPVNPRSLITGNP